MTTIEAIATIYPIIGATMTILSPTIAVPPNALLGERMTAAAIGVLAWPVAVVCRMFGTYIGIEFVVPMDEDDSE